MFINFNDLEKGEQVQGGLTPLKIVATSLKLWLQGTKPIICRPTKKGKGWFVRKGTGGKSGEPLVRMNFGTWYASFQAYDRNGLSRAIQNECVAIKGRFIQKKVA